MRAGFPIPGPGWQGEPLEARQLPELQRLLEACGDYFQLVEGRPTPPEAAQEEWDALPPGLSRDGKHLWGLRDGAGRLQGCLEGSEGHPEPGIGWLGLLLLHPSARRHGRGRAVEAAFAAWASARGWREIHLAVVEENAPALAFWQSLGYAPHRTVEGRVIGLWTHRLHVLRRPLR